MTSASTATGTIFHDLDHYVAMPRLGGLAMSPDGTRLVTTVSTITAAGTGYATALWGVDPQGEGPAYRITRSAKGEAGAAFSSTGSLLFTSARPDPDAEDDSPEAALWEIPAGGGEARVVLSRPGGVGQVLCAHDADVTVVLAGQLPGATDEATHAAIHKARKDAGVQAILHDRYPVRHWDADLGPSAPQLFVAEPAEQETPARPTTTDHVPPLRLRWVSEGVGATMRDHAPAISPDGTFAVVSLTVPEARGNQRTQLVRIDLTSGERSVLADEPGHEFSAPLISPDSTRAVIVVDPQSTPERAPHPQLHLLDLDTGERTLLAGDWDRWATPAAWLPDGSAVLVIADDNGRSPIFSIEVATGAVRQVTADDAAYSEVIVSPDGTRAYAVRSSYLFPSEVVAIDLSTGAVTPLPGPVERPEIPGRLEEVETTTEDGTRVRGWLALPEGEGPHPLLLWIHGGPLGSWNAWTWRWNPWLMTVQGYAVLLPDPALSTGYGQDFIQRGWGSWGVAPYEDLMAITDEVVARADIDESRTAAMGGSFGGYMANWVAGHTDRFSAIVTHASLWALDQFGPTTDAAFYWQREMTAEMGRDNSPHAFVDKIVTPVLVIHGDKDYRVPIGEGLRLWYELLAHSGLPAGDDGSTVHRFLYFPDENHWILSPQHAKVWYQVVSNFLAQHVLGDEAGELPVELGRSAPSAKQLRAAAAAQEEDERQDGSAASS
ncbi:S9 family peptidase [Ornithinimicrobium ciconiae]|uniref:S9 family peptidase n=1 Tax=Ornithinimicrobium ciconiae TaxID=2594265 RepID=A0A516G9S1_9MICO|nr:prolyl oligopeptidase family serine peptidase [Ornithinimicrobium ciconiae]QDO88279.1 S9 family peptidase [Ornithinimicrobium ciconiae]